MGTRRLFAGVAVEASAALRQVMAELRAALREERIRWVRPENLHLTVEFFGETDAGRIPELERALAQAARRTPPVALQIGGLGTYGSLRRPRVLWAGIESAGLQGLHDRVEVALRDAGWEPEPRAFAPHLTLGRMGGLKSARRFGDTFQSHREWAGPETDVRELILFDSRRGERGADYVPLGRYPLAEE